MWRTLGIFAAVLIISASWLSTGTRAAGEKVALVIGNSTYKSTTRLNNPANDAEDLSEALKRLGFDVTLKFDLDYGAMRRSLRDFGRKAHGANMALVYFAGHGMEVAKKNYLIPVDARLKSNLDVEYEAITLDLVMRSVSGAKGLRMVLLDACRNNPFAANMVMSSGTRSIGRGLSRVEPSGSTLVAYAAKAGTTADDGDGRNSPFSKALLQHIEQPGLEINFLFRKVRDSVMSATNGQQVPFVYGSLPGDNIYLKPPVTKAPKKEIAKASKVQPSVPAISNTASRRDATAAELLFWNTVKDSKDPEIIGAYVAEYPNGRFVRLARLLINRFKAEKKLEAKPVAEQPAPPKPQPAAPKVQPEAPKAHVASIDPETPLTSKQEIAEVQSTLFELKFEPGPADGLKGSRTTQAVRQFQKSAGLDVNGELTRGLLAALRAKSLPSAWGAIAFVPSSKSIFRRTGMKTRAGTEQAIRRQCGNCSSILVFSGEECGVIAMSANGWGWASRKGRKQARNVALNICGKYGSGCQVKATVCAK